LTRRGNPTVEQLLQELDSIIQKMRTVEYGDYVIAADTNLSVEFDRKQNELNKELNKKIDDHATYVDIHPWEKILDMKMKTDVLRITVITLDLDESKIWLLFFDARNPTASDTVYRLYFNGDFTDANYYTQLLRGSGTSVFASRENAPIIGSVPAKTSAFMVIRITRPPDGLPRFLCATSHLAPADIEITLRSGAYTIAGNVKRIDVESEVGDGIGAGSKLIMFGLTP